MDTNNTKEINRHDFMSFFRNDEKLNTLSTDDRIEIFYSILPGSSDFTKELLNNVLSDYSLDLNQIIEQE